MARRLAKLGRRQVRPLVGGIEAWLARNLPTEAIATAPAAPPAEVPAPAADTATLRA